MPDQLGEQFAHRIACVVGVTDDDVRNDRTSISFLCVISQRFHLSIENALPNGLIAWQLQNSGGD